MISCDLLSWVENIEIKQDFRVAMKAYWCWRSGYLHNGIMMFWFQHPSDPFIAVRFLVIVNSTMTAVRYWDEIRSAIVLELSDALIQVWEEIPLEIIHRLIRSMSRCCQEQALRGHTHYWVILWFAMIKFMEVGSASDLKCFICGGVLNPAVSR